MLLTVWVETNLVNSRVETVAEVPDNEWAALQALPESEREDRLWREYVQDAVSELIDCGYVVHGFGIDRSAGEEAE